MAHSSEPDTLEERNAGVLLHPTSLPGPFGIGDLGGEAFAFLDWAANARMHLWQVLPLNPPGYGNSPYGCHSSFAGNPLMISPQQLLERGLLAKLERVPKFATDHIDFDRVQRWKNDLLKASWKHFQQHASAEQRDDYARFAADEQGWLEDWALYAALKEKSGGAAWWDWDRALARREADALAEVRKSLAGEIDFHEYVQWLFDRQWTAVREAAHAREIRIVGDVPIYVAGDSADVWSHPDLFELDAQGHPSLVAGVPPDYFSKTGQRWGNPLYRWDVMKERGFDWWISRIKRNLEHADIIRLDHFRGFAAYWEIRASEPTAINGQWKPGPGLALFEAIRNALDGSLPLVAEDLGFITKDVHELRHAAGLPGMKILQFGFSQLDSPHLPHRFESKTIVYTGTHDNDTARGWYESAAHEEQELAAAYLGPECENISWALIRAAYASVASIAIVPAQDILNLGSDARMNRPGDPKHNWTWRLQSGALTAEHGTRLRRLAEVTGRA